MPQTTEVIWFHFGWDQLLHSLLLCSYFMVLSDKCSSCVAQWRPGAGCKVHAVHFSPPEYFLVAMLGSLFSLFSVFLSQTPTLSFLPETHLQLSSARHNSKTDKNSLFTVPYQSITVSACVCVCLGILVILCECV